MTNKEHSDISSSIFGMPSDISEISDEIISIKYITTYNNNFKIRELCIRTKNYYIILSIYEKAITHFILHISNDVFHPRDGSLDFNLKGEKTIQIKNYENIINIEDLLYIDFNNINSLIWKFE